MRSNFGKKSIREELIELSKEIPVYSSGTRREICRDIRDELGLSLPKGDHFVWGNTILSFEMELISSLTVARPERPPGSFSFFRVYKIKDPIFVMYECRHGASLNCETCTIPGGALKVKEGVKEA